MAVQACTGQAGARGGYTGLELDTLLRNHVPTVDIVVGKDPSSMSRNVQGRRSYDDNENDLEGLSRCRQLRNDHVDFLVCWCSMRTGTGRHIEQNNDAFPPSRPRGPCVHADPCRIRKSSGQERNRHIQKYLWWVSHESSCIENSHLYIIMCILFKERGGTNVATTFGWRVVAALLKRNGHRLKRYDHTKNCHHFHFANIFSSEQKQKHI